jgi:hypothetical protein
MTYVDDRMIRVGYSFVAFQSTVSAFFVGWTIWYRKTNVVRASQPMFLHLISFGCFDLALSIILTTVQGGYRYDQDPDSLKASDVFNDDMLKVVGLGLL